MLTQVERQSLPEAVFRQLRDRILDGRLPAGEKLPGERELAGKLGVNRNALREALKKLEQLKLIAIHPGGSTRVLDFRTTGGLDILVTLLFGEDGALRISAARALVELRTALGPDIAARAARRGGPGRAAELDGILEKMSGARDADPATLDSLSLGIWGVLVEASDNLAYRLAFNTMLEGWRSMQTLFAPALVGELRDLAGYRALVRAVAQGEPERARRAAARLVEKGEEGLVRLIGAQGTHRKRGKSK